MNDGQRQSSIRQTWQSLRQLTVENFGIAPWWLKSFVLALVAVFIVGFGWLLLIAPIKLEQASLATQESTLISQYAQKYAKAAQRQAMTQQVAMQQTKLSGVLDGLPNTFNMNALTEQIHAAAMRAGVQVADVKMGSQVESQLLFERSVTLTLVGDYRRLGQMLAELSQLSMPMTFHDFEMTSANPNQADGDIRLNIHAKTYRTKSPKEQQKGTANASK